MEVQINYWAVLLAGVSSMVVGAVWYAKPVFGTKWAKLAGLNDKAMSEGSTVALTVAFVLSLVTAYVLAHVAFLSNHFFGNSFFMDTLTTAFWMWLGFEFTSIITHNIFEKKPTALTALAVGNRLVTLLVMAVIIGWLHP